MFLKLWKPALEKSYIGIGFSPSVNFVTNTYREKTKIIWLIKMPIDNLKSAQIFRKKNYV